MIHIWTIIKSKILIGLKIDLIVSLHRDGKEFIPKGDTYLKASDIIIVMCDKADESYIYDAVSSLATEN